MALWFYGSLALCLYGSVDVWFYVVLALSLYGYVAHRRMMCGSGRRVPRVAVHEVGHNVNGDGEDDGAVVLCCDAVESLEISQLGGEMVSYVEGGLGEADIGAD